MQCVNCQFENMPGTPACVRCGTSLRLASAAVDIHPPRASDRAKRLRRLFPSQWYYYRIRDQLTTPMPGWLREVLVFARLRPGTWPRMLVPGWAHVYEGKASRGGWFFAGWILATALTILTWGSELSAVVAGAMLGVHAGAIIDLIWRSQPRERRAAIIAGIVAWGAALLVVLAIYTPVRWAVLTVVDARQWIAAEPPLARGDVILFHPVTRSQAVRELGQVVVYRKTQDRVGGQGNQILSRPAWEGIDRVIAGPGSVVRWRLGELTVDGETSDLRPLNPERMPVACEVRVPIGHVCVFPTTDSMFTSSGSMGWAEESIVPQEAIMGRAVVRNYPIWRFWWIR